MKGAEMPKAKPVATATETATILPILGCLTQVGDLIDVENPGWIPLNPEQKRFLNEVYRQGAEEVARIPEQELRSIAAKDPEAINRFLESEGFAIRLGRFQDARSIGLASVLKVRVKWVLEGTETSIVTEFGEFPAAKLEKEQVLVAHNHPHPIARIQTRTGDKVYVTIAHEPLAGLDLNKYLSGIEISEVSHDHEGVIFPMVDLNQKVDIKWIEGMKIEVPDGEWFIRQAVQQTIFKMNHQGALAKSASAMEVAFKLGGSRIRTPLIVDRPPFVWIKRPGFTTPIFAGYIGIDSWKDPRNLN